MTKSDSSLAPRAGLMTGLAMALVAGQAQATLILRTDTLSFGGDSTNTDYNDLPSAPNSVLFGQLQADTAGTVDLFYIGNEAGYINSLYLGGSSVHSVGADTFNGPYNLMWSFDVLADEFLDFGFCTSGGVTIDGSRCAFNNDSTSLEEQYSGSGYRSIGFAGLTSFNSGITGGWQFAGDLGASSNLWMILWDDSGAQNDDNHDDYVAVARFRPVSVPEPGALMLLGTGLLTIGVASRIRRRRSGT